MRVSELFWLKKEEGVLFVKDSESFIFVILIFWTFFKQLNQSQKMSYNIYPMIHIKKRITNF